MMMTKAVVIMTMTSDGFIQVKATVQCGDGSPEASASVLLSPQPPTSKKVFFGWWRPLCNGTSRLIIPALIMTTRCHTSFNQCTHLLPVYYRSVVYGSRSHRNLLNTFSNINFLPGRFWKNLTFTFFERNNPIIRSQLLFSSIWFLLFRWF